jgi:putative transposase
MNTKYIVRLSPAERQRLETLIHSGSALARVQTKARILLLTDHNQDARLTDAQIIRALSTSNSTIQRTRIQFVEGGVDAALFDKPRSGCPPKITGDIEAKLTMLACSDPPEGHARWTLQLLADQMIALGYIDTISDVAVCKRLKKRNQTLAR